MSQERFQTIPSRSPIDAPVKTVALENAFGALMQSGAFEDGPVAEEKLVRSLSELVAPKEAVKVSEVLKERTAALVDKTVEGILIPLTENACFVKWNSNPQDTVYISSKKVDEQLNLKDLPTGSVAIVKCTIKGLGGNSSKPEMMHPYTKTVELVRSYIDEVLVERTERLVGREITGKLKYLTPRSCLIRWNENPQDNVFISLKKAEQQLRFRPIKGSDHVVVKCTIDGLSGDVADAVKMHPYTNKVELDVDSNRVLMERADKLCGKTVTGQLKYFTERTCVIRWNGNRHDNVFIPLSNVEEQLHFRPRKGCDVCVTCTIERFTGKVSEQENMHPYTSEVGHGSPKTYRPKTQTKKRRPRFINSRSDKCMSWRSCPETVPDRFSPRLRALNTV